MKKILTLTLASLLFAGASAWAAGNVASTPAASGASTQPSADMTEGEVRKVDRENKTITLRHGEIKNLGMPGMTMVFQVTDPSMLDKVKAADKVRFKAEKMNGALTVTKLEAAK